eukprot:555697-Amphidinium_carterae.2
MLTSQQAPQVADLVASDADEGDANDDTWGIWGQSRSAQAKAYMKVIQEAGTGCKQLGTW